MPLSRSPAEQNIITAHSNGGGDDKHSEGNGMPIDLRSLREAFFEEAGRHLEQMQAALWASVADEAKPEQLDAAAGAAHFIRGNAGAFGLAETADFAYAVGSLLEGMRTDCVDRQGLRTNLLLEATRVLTALLDSARWGRTPPANFVAVRHRLAAAHRLASPDPLSAPHLHRMDAEVFLQAMNPALVLRELRRLETATS
jgi:chemotaxis protein histidine kinase CheA